MNEAAIRNSYRSDQVSAIGQTSTREPSRIRASLRSDLVSLQELNTREGSRTAVIQPGNYILKDIFPVGFIQHLMPSFWI